MGESAQLITANPRTAKNAPLMVFIGGFYNMRSIIDLGWGAWYPFMGGPYGWHGIFNSLAWNAGFQRRAAGGRQKRFSGRNAPFDGKVGHTCPSRFCYDGGRLPELAQIKR